MEEEDLVEVVRYAAYDSHGAQVFAVIHQLRIVHVSSLASVWQRSATYSIAARSLAPLRSRIDNEKLRQSSLKQGSNCNRLTSYTFSATTIKFSAIRD